MRCLGGKFARNNGSGARQQRGREMFLVLDKDEIVRSRRLDAGNGANFDLVIPDHASVGHGGNSCQRVLHRPTV